MHAQYLLNAILPRVLVNICLQYFTFEFQVDTAALANISTIKDIITSGPSILLTEEFKWLGFPRFWNRNNWYRIPVDAWKTSTPQSIHDPCTQTLYAQLVGHRVRDWWRTSRGGEEILCFRGFCNETTRALQDKLLVDLKC